VYARAVSFTKFINEVHHVFINLSVVAQVDVAFSSVCSDDISRSDMLLDQSHQSLVISVIVFTLHQEAVATSTLGATKEPLAFHSLSTVELSISDEGFVDFQGHQ
jgi:hypothetical protein